ncbi:phage tail tape measure protein [Clostridium sp. FP1]|uniref:phage tail tape measure protein n=1 Tax=Clostridium sp. FP1 TaxID=2724076 RepID=UPI0013E914A4|nr:phage tail tape measure protein [Clostridium sp. FP1]MBZ9633194.1 phage tail tape measure protein [Clostridium sp. FP1]
MTSLGDKIVKTSAKFLALGAIGGAGIILKIGIDGLKELDEASAKVKSIAQGDLEKKDIKKGLLKASNKTGVKVQELGDTQYNAISSGVSAKDSLEASMTSSKLGKAGFTDANSALKILTATMNVYGLSGQKAMQSISDKMLVTQNLGVTTVAELAESMGSLTPIAKSTGLSIDELLAGMVGLTKNGIKTDEAVTAMKGVMTSIISPSKEASDMAKSLGLNFSVAGLKSKGFVGFMEEIKKKTGGSTEKMSGLFGNVRALSGALVLAGGGLKDLKGGMDGMKNSTGLTDKAFEIMENTIGSKLDKFKNRFKNTCTSIVDTQSGALGQVADKMGKWLEENEGKIEGWVDNIGKTILEIYDSLKKVMDFMINNKSTIENFVIVFASFYVATKAVLALELAFKGLEAMIVITNGAMALSGVGLAILAIGSLIAIGVLLWKNWDTVKDKANDLCFMLSKAFDNVGTFVKNIFRGIANAFIEDVNRMIDLINKLPGIKINMVEKYRMEDYNPLAKPKGDSASRSYDARANAEQAKKTISKPATLDKYTSMNRFPKKALGTQYSYGGATIINDRRGGELVDLPSGAKVIPADKTDKILGGKGGLTVQVIVQGNVIGNEEYAEYLGNHIVGKVRLAYSNM